MGELSINDIKSFLATVHYSFLATAGVNGLPHIAITGNIEAANNGGIVITDFFCPQTIQNLSENTSVSLVIWDPLKEQGYQLAGRVVNMMTKGMLDGYVHAEREMATQAFYELDVCIDGIFDFPKGPHTDTGNRHQQSVE